MQAVLDEYFGLGHELDQFVFIRHRGRGGLLSVTARNFGDALQLIESRFTGIGDRTLASRHTGFELKSAQPLLRFLVIRVKQQQLFVDPLHLHLVVYFFVYSRHFPVDGYCFRELT